ncbi:RidA family protein, partial [Salmonella enterica]|nr:RidA family protein [Salmonella enterica]
MTYVTYMKLWPTLCMVGSHTDGTPE